MPVLKMYGIFRFTSVHCLAPAAISWTLPSRWRLETKVFGKPHYLQVVQTIFNRDSLVFTKTYQNNFPALVQVQVRLFKTKQIGRILDHGNHGPGNSQETSTSSTKISPENPLGSKYPQISPDWGKISPFQQCQQCQSVKVSCDPHEERSPSNAEANFAT